LILELLIDDSELYGLQLVARSKGKLKRGTVYVTLGRMEDKGFISSRLEAAPDGEGGLPRRIYQPTALGRRALRAYAHVVRQLAPEPAR
jgi:DNA-binding PadR family transcriptional regulator